MKDKLLPLTLSLLFLLNLSLSLGLANHRLFWPQTSLLLGKQEAESLTFPEITVQAAAQHLIDSSAVFVDARSREAFKIGHIPTAVTAPAGEGLPAHVMDKLLEAPLLIVYCDDKSCGASEKLARSLATQGLQNITLLEDGWLGWNQAGMPVMALPEGL